MRLVIMAVHDAVAEAWMNPQFFQSVGQGVRSFQDAVADGESAFGRHPEDYALYKLGEYDARTGLLEASAPQLVVHGANVNLGGGA